MKVRIGFGLGVDSRLDDAGFARCVDALEQLRFELNQIFVAVAPVGHGLPAITHSHPGGCQSCFR